MKKLESLYPTKAPSTKDMNIFEKELFKKSVETTSGNGSVKYSTSGNVFLDDYAAISNYREPRELDDIFCTMQKLCNENVLIALQLTAFIRMITRAPFFKDQTLGVHRGQGLKHEYIGRMYFFAKNYPKIFKRNLDVFIAIGSWNDLFEILRTDLYYNGKKRKSNFLFKTIIDYIIAKTYDKNQVELIKKYLPQIKPASKCSTIRNQANSIIAKIIATRLFPNEDKKTSYASYRRFKSSGTAHVWEQKISQCKFNELDFSLIAGRALAKLINSKFLQNHNLEDAYHEWIAKQPIAKFTGYPFELFAPFNEVYLQYNYLQNYKNFKPYQIETLNKQFKGLIETAKKDMNRETSFICCIDTSGSMTAQANGLKVSSLTVARSMALYFSKLLTGKFANTFLEFDRQCNFNVWQGQTAYENWVQTPISGWCRDTNFMSVADKFVELKQKGYDESEFPTGIICISDGEFNRYSHDKSVFESFLDALRPWFSKEFVDNFKLVLWDCPNDYYSEGIRPKFESLADRPNFYYMSGLDPAGIAFLTGTKYSPSVPKTAEELFEAALDQELIKAIK